MVSFHFISFHFREGDFNFRLKFQLGVGVTGVVGTDDVTAVVGVSSGASIAIIGRGNCIPLNP